MWTAPARQYAFVADARPVELMLTADLCRSPTSSFFTFVIDVVIRRCAVDRRHWSPDREVAVDLHWSRSPRLASMPSSLEVDVEPRLADGLVHQTSPLARRRPSE